MAINIVLNPLASLANQSTAISLINNNMNTIQTALANSIFVAPSNSIGLMRFALLAVNFHVAATDTLFPLLLPAGMNRYKVNNIFISNASASLAGATCGLFTSPSGGGNAIIPSTAVTVTTPAADTVGNMQTINATLTQGFSDVSIFFRVIAASTLAATADVILEIYPLS